MKNKENSNISIYCICFTRVGYVDLYFNWITLTILLKQLIFYREYSMYIFFAFKAGNLQRRLIYLIVIRKCFRLNALPMQLEKWIFPKYMLKNDNIKRSVLQLTWRAVVSQYTMHNMCPCCQGPKCLFYFNDTEFIG